MDGTNETRLPEVAQPNVGGEKSPEIAASTPETAPAADSSARADQPTKLSVADVAAAIAAMPTPTAPGQPAASTTPSVAADVDRIEPEWVHAAEDIIKQTADSPYAEEEAIEDLQIDYMQKRYGKIVDKKPRA
jgi:hypothetical protein